MFFQPPSPIRKRLGNPRSWQHLWPDRRLGVGYTGTSIGDIIINRRLFGAPHVQTNNTIRCLKPYPNQWVYGIRCAALHIITSLNWGLVVQLGIGRPMVIANDHMGGPLRHRFLWKSMHICHISIQHAVNRSCSIFILIHLHILLKHHIFKVYSCWLDWKVQLEKVIVDASWLLGHLHG